MQDLFKSNPHINHYLYLPYLLLSNNLPWRINTWPLCHKGGYDELLTTEQPSINREKKCWVLVKSSIKKTLSTTQLLYLLHPSPAIIRYNQIIRDGLQSATEVMRWKEEQELCLLLQISYIFQGLLVLLFPRQGKQECANLSWTGHSSLIHRGPATLPFISLPQTNSLTHHVLVTSTPPNTHTLLAYLSANL